MDNSNNNVDNQYLLNVPIAYTLQNKTVKDLESSFDSNGWNIMHYAVADANMPKITELIHFSFNWSVNGNKNCIPIGIYNTNEKKKPQKVKLLDKIPFCQSGFSPVHLAMFLFSHYNKLSDEYFYQKLCEDYMEIISLLVSNNGDLDSHIDADGLSLFDYAFLLEDLQLIDKIQMIDPGFCSLKKVPHSIAKQILEVMAIKHKIGGYDNVLRTLDKKILNDHLNRELKIKESQKCTIKKI